MSMVQQISRNQSVSVAAVRGTTVRVALGRVWLTRDGDVRDYVLNPGDSMVLEARGRVVLFGLTEAIFQVDSPERAPGMWTGLLARLIWMGDQA